MWVCLGVVVGLRRECGRSRFRVGVGRDSACVKCVFRP